MYKRIKKKTRICRKKIPLTIYMFDFLEKILHYVFVSTKQKYINKKNKKFIQKGKGYEENIKFNEFLSSMRKPIDSSFSEIQKIANKLIEEHNLTNKDALYIAVAEIIYPDEAIKYYNTVEKLVNKGTSLKEAVKIAFDNYMTFYKKYHSSKK